MLPRDLYDHAVKFGFEPGPLKGTFATLTLVAPYSTITMTWIVDSWPREDDEVRQVTLYGRYTNEAGDTIPVGNNTFSFAGARNVEKEFRLWFVKTVLNQQSGGAYRDG